MTSFPSGDIHSDKSGMTSPRASRRFPRVFIGCPYDEERFGLSQFKRQLGLLPWIPVYASATLYPSHLLDTTADLIEGTDFSIFDVSLWNSNVTLELGLAHGLNVPYYILLNKELSSGVPSDIQGLGRLEYTTLEGLGQKLADHFFKTHYYPSAVLWRNVNDLPRANERFFFGLRLLSYLRDQLSISMPTLRQLGKDLNLKSIERDEVLEVLWEEDYLVKIRDESAYKLQRARQLFKR